MTERRPLQLIPQSHVGYIRDHIGKGAVEVSATGRATCRGCGRKITAGLPALEILYDFRGKNWWCRTLIKVHVRECDCGPEYVVHLTRPDGHITTTTRRALELADTDPTILGALATLGLGESTQLEDGRTAQRLT